MGGHISRPSNKSMVDRLVERNCYISTQEVEGVFRAVDRALYFDIDEGEPIDPYEDDPWRRGNLHLSAPCIYAKAVEALDLKPGLSFLNLGSGTGYLSTIIGLLVGPNGINHGIEYHADVVDYANNRLRQFKEKSFAIDKYDFSEPIFIKGNCLNINPDLKYDRIYLGAACLPSMKLLIKKLVKPNGGILVMPVENNLVRYTRLSERDWRVEKLMDVNFTLMIGRLDGDTKMIEMPMAQPKQLKELCRIVIRKQLRTKIDHGNPKLLNSDNVEHRRRRKAKAEQALMRNNHKSTKDKLDNCCCNKRIDATYKAKRRVQFATRPTTIEDSSDNRIITRSKSHLLQAKNNPESSVGTSGSSRLNSDYQAEPNNRSRRLTRVMSSSGLGISESDSDDNNNVGRRHNDCSRTRPFSGEQAKTSSGVISSSREASPEFTLRQPPPPLRLSRSPSSQLSSPRSSDSESSGWSGIEDCERWCANHIRQVRLYPRYIQEPYEMQYSSDSSGSSDYEELLSEDYSNVSSDTDWESIVSVDEEEHGLETDSDASMGIPDDIDDLPTATVGIEHELYAPHISNEPMATSSNTALQADQQPVASRLRSRNRLVESNTDVLRATKIRIKPGRHSAGQTINSIKVRSSDDQNVSRTRGIKLEGTTSTLAKYINNRDPSRPYRHCCSYSHHQNHCRHHRRKRSQHCLTGCIRSLDGANSHAKPSNQNSPGASASNNVLQQPSLSPSSSSTSSSRLSSSSNTSLSLEPGSSSILPPSLFGHRLSHSFMLATDIGATLSMWTRSGPHWSNIRAGRASSSSSVSHRIASAAATAVCRASNRSIESSTSSQQLTGGRQFSSSIFSIDQRNLQSMADKSAPYLQLLPPMPLARKRKRDQRRSPPHRESSSSGSELNPSSTANLKPANRSEANRTATLTNWHRNHRECNYHSRGQSSSRAGCDCLRRHSDAAAVQRGRTGASSTIPTKSSAKNVACGTNEGLSSLPTNDPIGNGCSVTLGSTTNISLVVGTGAANQCEQSTEKAGNQGSNASIILLNQTRQEASVSLKSQQLPRAYVPDGSLLSSSCDEKQKSVKSLSRHSESTNGSANESSRPSPSSGASQRLPNYLMSFDDELASQVPDEVSASLRLVGCQSDVSTAEQPCQRHGREHHRNCVHNHNHRHHQNHCRHHHRNRHHHQNCRHGHDSSHGSNGRDVYLCRNHRLDQHSQEQKQPPNKRLRVSTDSSGCRRDTGISSRRRNVRRKREDECEKYHHHLCEYIRNLPLPRVLLTYLNCDRSF